MPKVPQKLIDEYRAWRAAGNGRVTPDRANNREAVYQDTWAETWKHPEKQDEDWYDRTMLVRTKLQSRLRIAGMMPRPDYAVREATHEDHVDAQVVYYTNATNDTSEPTARRVLEQAQQ
jgi:hypothetical protein